MLTHISWLVAAPFVILILAAFGIVLILEIAGFFSETPPPVEEGQAVVATEVAPGPAAANGDGQKPAADVATSQPPSTDSGAADPQNTTSDPDASGAKATTDDPKSTVDPSQTPDPPTEPDSVTDDPRDAEAPDAAADEDTHPLIVEITKEGYNVWAELKAALDEGAYGDVLRTMRLTPTDTPLGLLPDPTDESLFIPFQSLLAVATGDHPQLLDEMRANYGPVARVRLNAAIADSDAAGVQSVALRFFGTEAAGRAHRWLGDRELSAGNFRTAMRHYRQALASGFPEHEADLTARVRLAGAMLGLDLGEPLTGPVEFNELRLAPADFEEMVAEQLKRNAELADTSQATDLPLGDVPPAPTPAPYKLRRWSSVDAGQRGWTSFERLYGAVVSPDFDWSSWTLSATSAGRSVIVSNRQHLAAIDLVTGRHRWTQEFDETHGIAPTWYWIPMRPLVAADRIYAWRMPKLAMPQLVCLDVNSGRVRWASSPDNYVISRPFRRHDWLLALTISTAEPLRRIVALRARSPKSKTPDVLLTAFDPIDGTVLYQRRLVRLHDQWLGIIPCRTTTVGSDLIATVGGAVVCADLDGDIRWLRKQELNPARLRIRSQYHGPPLVVEDRVFVFQPGARFIECLDLETGRVVWKRELPSVTRVVGRADDRLIVQVDSEFLGLHAEDGSIVWRHEPDGLNNALMCGGPGGFAFVDRTPVEFGTWRLDLVWLDPQTGNVAARHVLSEIHRRGRGFKMPEPGPFLRVGERIFVGLSEEAHQPKERELYELVNESE